MAGHLPQLDRHALRQLRAAARLLQQHSSAPLPIRRILDLSRIAPADQGITIDFEASRDLGEALIVVRMPPCSVSTTEGRLACLSRREREVARLIAAGMSNKRIADRLCIATSTVKDHVHHILEKTRLGNRAAIAAAWQSATSLPGSVT